MDKRVLALSGLVVLVASSGCLGIITGEPLVFESSPAAVSNSSAAEAGFTLQQYNETKISESVEVMGTEREVRISLHQAVYSEQIPENLTAIEGRETNESMPSNESALNESLKPSVVTIVSVPDAQFFGQSVNPLVRLPNDELVKRFGGNSEGGLENLEQEGERSVQLVGSETELTVFNGTIESENGSTDALISVAKTAHDGDVVIVVAVQPGGSTNDTEKIDGFIEEIEHPTEAPK